MSWNSMLSSYSTQVPIENFITMMLIGVLLSGILFSLFNGIISGATPGWLPADNKSANKNLLYAVGFGFLVAGFWAAVGQLQPETTPSWLNYNYLNSGIPWLGLAASRTTNIILYPAFLISLYFGIDYFTNSWTKQKWTGILLAALAGFGLMAFSFEEFFSWIISGSIVAIFLWAFYFFFIRFHFEWIPISFGMIPLIEMLREIVVISNLNYILGGTLMIIMASAILYIWYRLLIKNSPKAEYMSIIQEE